MSFLFRTTAAISVFAVAVVAMTGVVARSSFAGQRTAVANNDLPGMPPVLDSHNIYSAAGVGMFNAMVKNYPARVYVPNSKSDTVDIIDPATYKIIGHFALPHLSEKGKKSSGLLEPQHVVPSWDLKKLWVAEDLGDQLTEIDPATGKEGKTIPIDDPYNMYYTPDGKYAIVMAERMKRLDFRDAQTMRVVNKVPVNCAGVNHADFTPDGRIMIATCEFSSELIKVDVPGQKVLAHLKLEPAHGMPQDCRIAPDGKVFYVANMDADGVHVIDPVSFRQIQFIHTGKGAHGLYFSRDSKYLYVSNRGEAHRPKGSDEGSISVIDVKTRKIVAEWKIPGGGSPDMGGVSADGKYLWLSGRYDSEVYVFDTSNGSLKARIKVGREPHGLCLYPQPGRYSLGHTGNMR